jgi:hypothetical protein
LKRFVPGVDTDRENVQESKNLPVIEKDVLQMIERSEKDLIKRYYGKH